MRFPPSAAVVLTLALGLPVALAPLLSACTGPPAADDTGTDAAPALTLESPRNGDTFAEGALVPIFGFTVDDRDAADTLVITVTTRVGGAVAVPLVDPPLVDAEGRFAGTLALSPGSHALAVTVTDTAGNAATATVAFTLDGDPSDDPPTAPTLHIEPAAPVTAGAFSVVVDTAPVDPEGAPVTVAYRWTLAGVEQLSTADVPADLAVRGEEWTVEVWGNDGALDGPAASATVVIGNAPPAADSVEIGPSDASIETPLVCTVVGARDPEADPLTTTFAWTVAGAPAGGATDTLAAGSVADGEDVVCTATLDDGRDQTAIASAPFELGNTVPGAPTVAITPASPADTDALLCVVTATAIDPDGDTVTYAFAWTVGGAPSGYLTDEVPAEATHRDEVWACTVTARDPAGLAVTASAVATIGLAWDGADSAGSADVTIDGATSAGAFGKTIAVVGDVDGDGLSELLVGANGENSVDGAVYLFGGADLFGALTTSDAIARWDGAYTDGQLGGFRSMAAPGDLDGDGAAELLFAAADADANGEGSGIAYLVYGGGALSLGADPSAADWSVTGTGSDQIGARLAAGDLDGDGFTDLALSAPGASDSAATSGTVAWFFGDGARFAGASTSARADYSVMGNAENDGLGWTARMVGDVDGDGYADAALGAMYADPGGSESGLVGLVLGSATLSGSDTLTAASAALFSGDAAGDRFGYDIVGDSDLDQDGTTDLLLAAYQDDTGATDAGAVYLYLGRSAWASAYDPADADATFTGTAAAARFGHVMASPGDLDSDGTDDIVFGALFATPTGLLYQGAASILLAPDWSATASDTDLPWSASGEAASDLFGDALGAGRGDIDGDGRSDFAVGAQGHDTGGSGAGRVYLWLGR